MILRSEIAKKAAEWGVPAETVDKDWVLGHFLSAFYSIGEHREKIVFKGGTALRKCYISNYRFSEDLDFTSLTKDYKLTKKILTEIITKAGKHSGVLLHIQGINKLIFNNKLTGFSAKIKYWGANHSKNQAPPNPERWTTNIKIEITLFEKMVFSPNLKLIRHPYSDSLLKDSEKIPCYDLKEVMAEKIRALIQRSYSAPRDYYDIYYLQNLFSQGDWKEIKAAFWEKLAFKGIKFDNVGQLLNAATSKNIIKAWKSSLTYQIPEKTLPDAELVIEEIKQTIRQNL